MKWRGSPLRFGKRELVADGFAEQDRLDAERRLQETRLGEPSGLLTKSQTA